MGGGRQEWKAEEEEEQRAEGKEKKPLESHAEDGPLPTRSYGKPWDRFSPAVLREKLAQPTPWSQTFQPPDHKTTRFCYFSHPVCGTSSGWSQPLTPSSLHLTQRSKLMVTGCVASVALLASPPTHTHRLPAPLEWCELIEFLVSSNNEDLN